ncbi:MAG: NFACT family protein [Bacteroidetes bacterium]|nr:NFACT family protein [Bacteroidota bacterium]
MSPNNHELIAKIAGYLNQQLKGFYLRDCFSLNKQELIFIFRQRNETFAFELFYDSQESFVFFPLRVSTPRNPQNIFPQLENALVLGVEVVKDDRSFIIKFDEGKTLLFKLYGRNANVILFTKNKVLSVFRENLKSDLAATLPKDLLTPTLDESINILYTQNEYAREYLSHKKFEDTGKQLRTEITKKIDRVGAKINSNQKQLASLANDTDYRTKADLLMANLHAISMESKEVVLQNFYTNLPTKIKLKEGISPQENAERFYRKSKNQIKEKEILLQLKSDLQKELEALLLKPAALYP